MAGIFHDTVFRNSKPRVGIGSVDSRRSASSRRKTRCSLRSSGLKWWLSPESNRGHEDFQSSALPTELPSHGGMANKVWQLRHVNGILRIPVGLGLVITDQQVGPVDNRPAGAIGFPSMMLSSTIASDSSSPAVRFSAPGWSCPFGQRCGGINDQVPQGLGVPDDDAVGRAVASVAALPPIRVFPAAPAPRIGS